jgi:PPM family protein phosphatase
LQSKNLIFAMLTDPGRVRRGNEDVCAASPEAGVFVVCDGMGGAAAGEVASHLASQAFLDHLTTICATPACVQNPHARLNAAINAANRAVFQESQLSPELAGMGTTLVALLYSPIDPESISPSIPSSSDSSITIRPVPPTLWLAHVGDSRCYRRRGRELTLLTADHSLVEEQVRAGHITPAEAASSPMRNLITRAVGSQPDVEAEIQCHRPRPGDLYLLASDGLTCELSTADIAMVLADIPSPVTEPYLAAACRSLVKAANQNGGRDNITVILVAFPA